MKITISKRTFLVFKKRRKLTQNCFDCIAYETKNPIKACKQLETLYKTRCFNYLYGNLLTLIKKRRF